MNTILALALSIILSGPIDTSPKTDAPCNVDRGWVMPEDGSGCVYAPAYYGENTPETVQAYEVLYVQAEN